MAFTSLNQYLDVEWMRYAYECTRKDGAVGVDGQTGQDYALHLERNLCELIDRLKSGRYRAPSRFLIDLISKSLQQYRRIPFG